MPSGFVAPIRVQSLVTIPKYYIARVAYVAILRIIYLLLVSRKLFRAILLAVDNPFSKPQVARPQQYRISIVIACLSSIGYLLLQLAVIKSGRIQQLRAIVSAGLVITIIPRPDSNSDLQIISLTYCRYAIRTINMYNDILRIRTRVLLPYYQEIVKLYCLHCYYSATKLDIYDTKPRQ